MATYTPSTLTTSTKLAVNDIIYCTYSGSKATIQLPPGEYRLECWGAQGGSFNTTYYGGKGGYSKGDLKLTTNTVLYLYTGGQGTNGTTSGTFAGGFNGGGQAYTGSAVYDMSAGGGGTDIRIKQDSLYARVIVAGGGGGAGSYSSSYRYSGGAGGGTSGTAGSQYSTSYRAGGRGTATSAGISYYGSTSNSTTYGTLASFGQGGAAKTTSTAYHIAGGGGGWYGGGYSRRGPGGGGSGYVYTASTYSQYPSGCLLNSSYYLTNASTSAGTSSFLSPSGSSETGHTGNGYIRITVLGVAKETKTYLKITGSEWLLLSTAITIDNSAPVGNASIAIDNKIYTIELNSNWGDWVNNPSLNTDGFYIDGNYIRSAAGNRLFKAEYDVDQELTSMSAVTTASSILSLNDMTSECYYTAVRDTDSTRTIFFIYDYENNHLYPCIACSDIGLIHLTAPAYAMMNTTNDISITFDNQGSDMYVTLMNNNIYGTTFSEMPLYRSAAGSIVQSTYKLTLSGDTYISNWQ